MHTLCLVDIKVKEPNLEAMARGKIIYEPPRYGKERDRARETDRGTGRDRIETRNDRNETSRSFPYSFVGILL